MECGNLLILLESYMCSEKVLGWNFLILNTSVQILRNAPNKKKRQKQKKENLKINFSH